MSPKVNKERLNRIFNTSDCLSEQELLDYTNNVLSNIERNKIEQHTINCQLCSEALEGFQNQQTKKYIQHKKEVFDTSNKSLNKLLIFAAVSAAAIFFIFLLFKDLQEIHPELTAEHTEENRESNNRIKNKTIIDTFEVSTAQPEKTIKKNDEIQLISDSINKSYQWTIDEENIKLEGIELEKKEKHKALFNLNNKEKHTLKIRENEDVKNSSLTSNKRKQKIDNGRENKIPINSNKKDKKINLKADKVEKKNKNPSNTSEFEGLEESLDTYDDAISDESLDMELDTIQQNYSMNGKNKIIPEVSNLDYKPAKQNGFQYFIQEKYEKSVTELLKIKKEDDRYFEAQLYIGKSYLKLKKKDKAKEYLKKALEGNNQIRDQAKKLIKTIK